ncbi:hypothetical protein PtB15_15B472 [Puccinia triticina]|nr:hypothetical protein PtB15_15B472 [Puccinia triticina]
MKSDRARKIPDSHEQSKHRSACSPASCPVEAQSSACSLCLSIHPIPISPIVTGPPGKHHYSKEDEESVVDLLI